MSTKLRFVLFTVLVVSALALTGCAGAISGNAVAPVASSAITTSMNYVDGSNTGPVYNVSVTVPDAWVGQLETQNLGNVLQFKTSDTGSLIFSIEALSATQYWQASGSYPAGHTNIVNLGDTYFVYHVPVDAYYSGLSAEDFQVLVAAVPEVIASFTAEAAK